MATTGFGSGFFIALVASVLALAPRSPSAFAAGVLAYAFFCGMAYAAFSAVVPLAIGRGAVEPGSAVLLDPEQRRKKDVVARLAPASRAKAPAIAGLQSGKACLRLRRRQVVAALCGERSNAYLRMAFAHSDAPVRAQVIDSLQKCGVDPASTLQHDESERRRKALELLASHFGAQRARSIDDHRERQVWDATARVIQHCFHGVVNCQERGWTLIPFWLRSVDRNKEDTKPFRTYIAPYTLRRYISYWQQFIMFSLRAIMVEDSVQFSDRQRECLLELNSLIFEMDVDSEIEKKIFELSVLLIQHSDYAKEQSSLIYFTGVLGYNLEWKQWRQPLQYTTILAGIQFCIRVIMLEASLPTEMRDNFNETSLENPVQAFRKVRDQWLVDGEGM